MGTRFGVGANTFFLRGGRVCDPAGGVDGPRDLLVRDGIVRAMGPDLPLPESVPALDVGGCLVSPGFLDLHVHLREPGQEEKETIASGTAAAASGGFTAVACMPNTVPPVDTRGTLEFILRKAEVEGRARVYPVAAITVGLAGERLTEMGELVEAGAVAFSDDGLPVESSSLMRRAMEYAAALGVPIFSHAEDRTLAAGGVMNEGELSIRMGLKGIPSESEDVAVVRDILLARRTSCRLHICHVSTAGAVDAIRRAKAEGLAITAEATPHHFSLTEAAVTGYRTDAKVNPPLRGETDRQAVVTGLADGTIDAIATDHAPHTAEEKEAEFDRAPFGLIGLETALSLAVTELVEPGHLSYADLVGLMCVNPRTVIGIAGRTIRENAVADLTVWNPKATWVVSRDELASLAANTPFLGRRLTGRAALSVSNGKVTHWREPLATEC